jgi:general secretion pathway protein E
MNAVVEASLPAEAAHPSVPQTPTADTVGQVEEHLRKRRKLSDSDLFRAQRVAAEGSDSPTRLLVRLGMVSEKDMAEAFSQVLNLPLAQACDYPATPAVESRLALRFMKDAQVVPLREEDDQVVVSLADPTDPFVLKSTALAFGKRVAPLIGIPSEIESAIERLFGEGKSQIDNLRDELTAGEGAAEDDIEHLKDLASEAPIIRLVSLIIQRAVEQRASDIHIEPFEDQLKIRYRIDGVLHEKDAPPTQSAAAVISRVKILAKLNIAERRLPQDGRIPLRVQGKELDLRVSTVPTLYGESVVMRLLDKESVNFDFGVLGFEGSSLERLLTVLDRPHGIVLVTGPTGSGKSTTLYTALSRLNTPERKIITVEDPVEYQLDGINQIQVKPQVGLSFANALRAIVRQDPDIIMVGEMRDVETARIAVQSALTGHLVLSTLHTNDAAGGVARLLDMGVEDYLITSTVNGIVGQRLVRRLCSQCKSPYPAPQELLPKLAAVSEASLVEPVLLYQANGCEACGGTGFFGRLVIAEVLHMTDPLRRAVLSHSTASEIRKLATAEGMHTIHDDGINKALKGLTTLQEVIRATEAL